MLFLEARWRRNLSMINAVSVFIFIFLFSQSVVSDDQESPVIPSLTPSATPFVDTSPSILPKYQDVALQPTLSPSSASVIPTTAPIPDPSPPLPTFAPSEPLTFAPTLPPTELPTFSPSEPLSFAPTESIYSPPTQPATETSSTDEERSEAPTIVTTLVPTTAAIIISETFIPSFKPTLTPTTEPSVVRHKRQNNNDEYGTDGLYTVYLVGLVLVIVGTFYFFVRNYGDQFGFSYTPVNTVGDDEDETHNPVQSQRDIELARFQRMAESMRSYPPPSGSPRNNRR